MTETEWFRCYLPPCIPGKRTDTTWPDHYAEAHAHTEARAITRRDGTDLLPVEERGGREAFLLERERMKAERP